MEMLSILIRDLHLKVVDFLENKLMNTFPSATLLNKEYPESIHSISSHAIIAGWLLIKQL